MSTEKTVLLLLRAVLFLLRNGNDPGKRAALIADLERSSGN